MDRIILSCPRCGAKYPEIKVTDRCTFCCEYYCHNCSDSYRCCPLCGRGATDKRFEVVSPEEFDRRSR